MYLVYPRSHNHETTAKAMILNTNNYMYTTWIGHAYMFVQNINKLNKMSDHIGNLTEQCVLLCFMEASVKNSDDDNIKWLFNYFKILLELLVVFLAS